MARAVGARIPRKEGAAGCLQAAAASHTQGVPAGGETKTAAGYLPERPTLDGLREAAAGRRGHLWKRATQTVFGEGAARAGVMLVGEQPRDQEDVAGKPLVVGPAGRLLDQASRKRESTGAGPSRP
jgi:hypothetical protein